MSIENTDTAARVVRNSIWLFTAETLSKFIALAVQIIAARYLGDKGFGLFSFAFSATSILMILADAGINTFLTREISRDPDRMNYFLGNAFFLKGLLSLLAILLLVVFPIIFSLDEQTRWVVWAIGFALLINGYADIYISVFRAFEAMGLVSILSILQRVLFFSFGLGVLLMGYRVIPFAMAFLLAAVINLVHAWWQMRKRFGSPSWKKDWTMARKIFASSVTIGGTVFCTYIYFRIDSVMLYAMRGEAETGWYSAAFKLIETAVVLIASIRVALFPLLSRTFVQQNEQFRKIWQEVARYLLLLGLPLAVGTALLAHRMIEVFYGEMYAASGPALRLLALVLPLLFLNDIASYLLVSADRARSVLKAVAAAAVLNVILNWLWIPRWGLLGAAAATCLTEIFVFGVYYAIIKKICGSANLLSLLWRPAVSAAGMILFLVILFFLSAVPLIILGAVVYFGLLIALKTFNKQDRLVFRSLFNR
ncbi:MAG: flippase [Nitrospinales bacterium]